jgi:hypothetical protein
MRKPIETHNAQLYFLRVPKSVIIETRNPGKPKQQKRFSSLYLFVPLEVLAD